MERSTVLAHFEPSTPAIHSKCPILSWSAGRLEFEEVRTPFVALGVHGWKAVLEFGLRSRELYICHCQGAVDHFWCCLLVSLGYSALSSPRYIIYYLVRKDTPYKRDKGWMSMTQMPKHDSNVTRTVKWRGTIEFIKMYDKYNHPVTSTTFKTVSQSLTTAQVNPHRHHNKPIHSTSQTFKSRTSQYRPPCP